ncbi:hypothetical protein H4R19_005123 [Coemansia spiralis]|nr:hypothetical protein H4R19_005123 [Coemansia spiralis]
MAIYSCETCGVHFDSKGWYDGHLRRAHGAPAKLEISSTTSLTEDIPVPAPAPPKRQRWPRRFRALFVKKVAAF